MSLFTILSLSAQGLSAHRARAHVASHNLANVSTEGYTRQRGELAAGEPFRVGRALMGGGVDLAHVSRARDRFLEAQVSATYGRAARASAERDVILGVRALDADVEGRVDGAIASFFAALRSVAQDPGDLGARHHAVATAKELARSFSSTASALDGARRGVDERLAAEAEEATRLAAEVAELNRAIARERGAGVEPNDLLDARQRAADRLASLTGAIMVPTDDGDVNLFLDGRIALVVGTEAGRLTTSASPLNRGHLDVALQGASGAPQTLSGDELGGEMGGALSARDGALRTALDELDALAFELAGALNAVHEAGYGLSGSTGERLFDVGAGAQGAASRMAVAAGVALDPRRLAAAAAAGGVPGDDENMRRLIDVERTPLAGGLSAHAAAVQLVARFGAEGARASSGAAREDAVRAHLDELRSSVAGVSIEEEMVRLTEAQRAFEAMSKVITTTDEMLDTLMSLR